MNKSEIFSEIRTLNKTIKELTSKIIIEDLFNIVRKDKNGNPIDNDLKITYGVTVRLSKDTADDFFPFSYCWPYYDSTKAANNIENNLMIPDLLNNKSIKELLFTAVYDKKNDQITTISIDIPNSRHNTVSPYNSCALESEGENKDIENWLKHKRTFLDANIKELVKDSDKDTETFFAWICGEDPDVTDEQCGYLTNIMVISNKESYRQAVIEKKADFIEFVMWLKSRRSYDSDIKFKNEAIKSAKAAIMSRNMSHNLGSHVMSYLKQNLSSVKNIFHDRILALLVKDPNSIQIDSEIQTAIKEGDQGILPFLVGLGQFISYIQERQDFIATIATDFIPYLSTVNFKDFIYDELNPDKRYERHTTRQNYKTDNILLGNIARSEGLGRKTSPTEGVQLNNIVLYFRDFDGDPVEQQEDRHPTGKALPGREKEFKTLKDMRSYDFSLPGGVVGRQAVFSIVENVIRNAAKHGNWREEGQLELTFNIYTKEDIESVDKNNEYNNACLDDRPENGSLSLREVFQRFYLPAKDATDLYFITLTDNLSIDDTKLDKLRKAINEGLVNERGEMNEASKGIKEMRISSTWLRSLNDGETYNPIKFDKEDSSKLQSDKNWKQISKSQNAPALYARISNGHLQYIFCVLRPKKVAIISSLFTEQKTDDNRRGNKQPYNKEAFLKYSWAAFTPEQYRDVRNKSYEFILFDDSDMQEQDDCCNYDSLRKLSSSRFWKLSDIKELPRNELFNIIKNMTDKDIDSLLTTLYKHLSHYEDGDTIIVDDKTAAGNVNRDTKGKTPVYSKSEHILVQDGIISGIYKYIYRTHHDTEVQYKNFIKAVNDKTIQNNIFVEGITGNNSTDRLVRNEKLDDVWFYKHLHAMKEQIAIFDERLFTKIFGIEESHLKSDETVLVTADNFYDFADDYCSNKNLSEEDVKWIYAKSNREEAIKKIQEENDKNKKPVTSIAEKESPTGYLPIIYKQKGINTFTIIQDPNPKCRKTFNLYGLKKTTDLKNSICTKIATLSWDKDGLHFNGAITDKSNKYQQFDRISIHQGLLDKLYEVFGIKDNPQEKERLTRQFYITFANPAKLEVKDSTDNPNRKGTQTSEAETYESIFLSGMSIHSGRSKPSLNDMPQKIPFIQYASIENAVLDCKYSLVELLDFARYE